MQPPSVGACVKGWGQHRFLVIAQLELWVSFGLLNGTRVLFAGNVAGLQQSGDLVNAGHISEELTH